MSNGLLILSGAHMARLKGQLKAPTEAIHGLSKYDRTLLYGASQICDYMRCSQSTLRSWVKRHAFPAVKMPNGSWVSSTQLIDDWIIGRSPYLSQFCAKQSL